MRRLVSLLAASALAAALLVLAPASPASANGVCVGALGSANLSTGLLYPNPLDTPPAGDLGQETAAFGVGFTTGTCVNVSTVPPGTTTKNLTATGTVTGWCGHSTGAGVTGDGHSFVWTSAGSFLVLTGGLTGVVNAVPDAVNGESCSPLGPGADAFLVSGVAVKLHCWLTTPILVPVLLGAVWVIVCHPTLL